jgi:hypothetical protein
MTSIGGLLGCIIVEDGRRIFFVAKYIHTIVLSMNE